MKWLGDQAFCAGINRFVFHRYTMQPYRNLYPGLSMGPFGVHYERTQTWWQESREPLGRTSAQAASGRRGWSMDDLNVSGCSQLEPFYGANRAA